MVVVPARSLAQRMTALDHANAVRIPRARLKERIRAADVKVAAVLADPPGCVLTMKVSDLLLAQHRWGRARVGKLLWRLEISPVKTIGGLTSRQRVALIDELTSR